MSLFPNMFDTLLVTFFQRLQNAHCLHQTLLTALAVNFLKSFCIKVEISGPFFKTLLEEKGNIILELNITS